jgi:hypothetical protein
VRMIQRGNGFGFTLEAFRELRGGNLYSHVAVQTRISGAVHLTHAPSANGREDLVGTEFFADRERHVIESAKFNASRSG